MKYHLSLVLSSLNVNQVLATPFSRRHLKGGNFPTFAVFFPTVFIPNCRGHKCRPSTETEREDVSHEMGKRVCLTRWERGCVSRDGKEDVSHPLIFIFLDCVLLLLCCRTLSPLEVVQRFGEVGLQSLSLQLPLPEHHNHHPSLRWRITAQLCHQHYHQLLHLLTSTIIITNTITWGQEPARVDNCSTPSAESSCLLQVARCSAGSGAWSNILPSNISTQCKEGDGGRYDVDGGDRDGG